jgi:hypothetical protein
MCRHEWVEQEKRIHPPKHCSFRVRYNVCVKCGEITATIAQRKKNRKQSNGAYNKYARQQMSEG